MNKYSVQQLTEIGGNEWQGGKHHRIYFNDLESLCGLSVTRYGTGNISSAMYRGESISNSKAKKILGELSGKFWYDVNTGEFEYQIDEDLADDIIEEISRRVK